MEWITVHAKTLDEAISKAAMEINTPSYNLEYKVKQEASTGIFGLFSKECVIEARKKPEQAENKPVEKQAEKTAAPKPAPAAPVVKESTKEEKAVRTPAPEAGKKPEEAPKKSEAAEEKTARPAKESAENSGESRPERDGQRRRRRGDRNDNRSRDRQPRQPRPEKEAFAEEKEVPEKKEVVLKPMTQEEKEGCEKAALEFLKQIFGAMGIEVEMNVVVAGEEREVTVEMAGADMGILIGKRGQTLDSLQYLVSLVVNKTCGDYVRVKLDTENYRARRKDTLESLAKNIAYRVKRSRKSVSLEPMNPYERRIIHAALQNDKYVTTRSEGEDPYRHVVISLKREARNDRRDNRRNQNRQTAPVTEHQDMEMQQTSAAAEEQENQE